MADPTPPKTPRKKVHSLLFGKPVPIDNSGDITAGEIEGIVREHAKGVTLAVREKEEAEQRGGYLFSVLPTETGGLRMFTYSGREAYLFANIGDFVRFVNHASGRRYDRQMWEVSQEINLRVPVGEEEETEEGEEE